MKVIFQAMRVHDDDRPPTFRRAEIDVHGDLLSEGDVCVINLTIHYNDIAQPRGYSYSGSASFFFSDVNRPEEYSEVVGTVYKSADGRHRYYDGRVRFFSHDDHACFAGVNHYFRGDIKPRPCHAIEQVEMRQLPRTVHGVVAEEQRVNVLDLRRKSFVVIGVSALLIGWPILMP